ncbi:MAG: HAD hydrolase-like protein [Firmicutes bacterium]|nr:HAD hydrolase-like protein [Bacillota bacterium]
MAKDIREFCKNKDYLICVDSDGCAMDTMNIKHFRCFGPCMVREWGLQAYEKQIQQHWNEINLYSMTRGINRFKGLAAALLEVDRDYRKIPGIQIFADWAENAPELSNRAVKERAGEGDSDGIFAKALSWSLHVNESIDALPQESKKAFSGVREALACARQKADVAVVSSANKEAVIEEWERCGLLELVDVLCCQDAGTKKDCIATLLAKGYAPQQVLVLGDAPGDERAAAENGVYFYPILVKKESESWKEFRLEAFDKFTERGFADYEQSCKKKFFQNLGQSVS